MDNDSMFFNDYCIVCDRAIIAPKEPEPVVATKKKVAAGAIRIKNADGTVTTRTANGQKITRPPLRRGPSSANRLAAVAAANNTCQPLTRSKTAEPANHPSATREPTSSPEPVLKTPASAPSETPFLSSIYCSRACAQVEASRSTDLARKLSYDLNSPSGLHLITTGLPISDSHRSPYAPPSPLFISGSETSSNPDAPASAEPAACSAPNAMSFFHMHRDSADEAWRDVNKQRRSSVHPSFRPAPMARQPSHASTFSAVGQSSDSLSSMWVGNEEVNLGRSSSGPGKIRMTPMTNASCAGPSTNTSRRASSSADRSATIPVRPLPRSTLSQVSLTAAEDTSPMVIPAEFGSAPEHTLNLWNTYHNSFNQRDATGTSSSRTHAFVGTTPTSPPHGIIPTRRPSHSHVSASIQRPVGGTIRAKSKTDVTWDSFGRDEVLAHKKRQERMSGVEPVGNAQTPKQTISISHQGCTIRYPSSSRRMSNQTSSTDSEEESTVAHPGALAIPQVTRPGRSISPGRTPTGMPPPASIPSRHNSSTQVPDLASLRIGAGCATSSSYNASAEQTGHSAPKATFNWNKWEEKGGRTYTVPSGLLKANSNSGKTGLFFFK